MRFWKFTSVIVILACALVSGALLRGGGGASPSGNPLLSQRNVLNLNFTYVFDYAFINMIQQAGPSITPQGGFTTGSTFTQLIDANGWPNNAAASGQAFGGGIRMPSSANLSGPYVVTWKGTGSLYISGLDGSGATCTETNANTTWTKNGNCDWTNKAGHDAYIVANFTGVSANSAPSYYFYATGGADGFVHDLKIYRQADEADLLAGKIFRTAFKQSIVDHNPSALRFMNWHGNVASQLSRWEYRTKPNNAGWTNRANFTSSPPYGETTSSGNAYSLAAVSTGGNQTPASMLHGETVTARFNSDCVHAGGSTVTAIQNQNVPQITTADPLSFQAGDTIVIYQRGGAAVSGMMTRLNFFPVTIASRIDATHYTINVDTTTWGAFTANPSPGGNIAVDEYLSLQVGSGNDRTAYPIVFADGRTAYCRSGTAITAQGYLTLVFNKNVAAKSDGAGNYAMGVWVANESTMGLNGDVPIEVCVALVNELNALSLSQGIVNPIHMMTNVPYMGLLSTDPDYLLASNYPVQMVNAILNGGTFNGVTYAGLTSRAKVVVEYGNETWNSQFDATHFMEWQGFLRWPTSFYADNDVDMMAFRSTLAARDVRANVVDSSRVYFVMGGMFVDGWSLSGNGLNLHRSLGNSTPGQVGYWYTTDSLVVSQGWGTPISWHDGLVTAPYLDAASSTRDYYQISTGTHTFTDDSAMYNGLDNSPNGGGNYFGAANPTQAIANFITQVQCDPSCVGGAPGGYSLSTARTLRAQMAAGLPAGKVSAEYEGGANWPLATGGNPWFGHTVTSGDAAFFFAIINSSQWRDAQLAYFNYSAGLANTGPSSLYTYVSADQWVYARPDSYAGSVEGQALLNSSLWVGAGARNQALRP